MTDYYFHHLNSMDNTGDVSPLVKGNKIDSGDTSASRHSSSTSNETTRQNMVRSAQQAGGFDSKGTA